MSRPPISAAASRIPNELGRPSPSLPMGDARVETRLLLWLLGVSLVIHLFVILVDVASWIRFDAAPAEEWVLDADLVGDLDLGGVKETALPNSLKDENPALQNLLPQLPKSFSVNDADKPDDDSMVDPDKKEEEEKAKDKTITPPDQDNANRLDMDELRKRKALEDMRRKLKERASTARAPTKAEVAGIRERLQAGGILGGGGSGSGPFRKCLAIMRTMVKNSYAMPDAYDIRGGSLEVTLDVVLAENGNVMRADVARSSGNAVFDGYALKALRDASPFPEDCKEMAGQNVQLRFRP